MTGGAPTSVRWSQVARLTVVALLVYAGLRQLGRAGEALSHSDFRIEGRFTPEYCDPGEPKFIPIERVRGAVTVELMSSPPLEAGKTSRLVFRVQTATGRPIRPGDLLLKHTRLMHVLAVDLTSADYQHLHPEPAGDGAEGLWSVDYAPRLGGQRRFFVEFTPKATTRSLYGLAEMEVFGGVLPPAPGKVEILSAESSGLTFSLQPPPTTVFAGRRATVRVTVGHSDGTSAALEPVMGAWMHLVAFDEGATGFVHIHPDGVDPMKGTVPAADAAGRPPREFAFVLEVPRPGPYRLWAQVRAAGADVFAPFTLLVH